MNTRVCCNGGVHDDNAAQVAGREGVKEEEGNSFWMSTGCTVAHRDSMLARNG